jgi:hypothetical protein
VDRCYPQPGAAGFTVGTAALDDTFPVRSPKLLDQLSSIPHRHNLGEPGYLVLPTPYAWSEALAKKEQTPETSALPETDLCKRSIILFRFWTGIALYCDMEFPLRESLLGSISNEQQMK